MLRSHLNGFPETTIKTATRLLVTTALVAGSSNVTTSFTSLRECIIPLNGVLIRGIYREFFVALSVGVHVAGLETPLSVAVVLETRANTPGEEQTWFEVRPQTRLGVASRSLPAGSTRRRSTSVCTRDRFAWSCTDFGTASPRPGFCPFGPKRRGRGPAGTPPGGTTADTSCGQIKRRRAIRQGGEISNRKDGRRVDIFQPLLAALH